MESLQLDVISIVRNIYKIAILGVTSYHRHTITHKYNIANIKSTVEQTIHKSEKFVKAIIDNVWN